MNSVYEFAVSAKPKAPLAIGVDPLGTQRVYEFVVGAPKPVRRRNR